MTKQAQIRIKNAIIAGAVACGFAALFAACSNTPTIDFLKAYDSTVNVEYLAYVKADSTLSSLGRDARRANVQAYRDMLKTLQNVDTEADITGGVL